MPAVGHLIFAGASVVWLGSDKASHLTGTILVVDGGRIGGVPAD